MEELRNQVSTLRYQLNQMFNNERKMLENKKVLSIKNQSQPIKCYPLDKHGVIMLSNNDRLI